MPVLANVLVSAVASSSAITGTDLEVELVAQNQRDAAADRRDHGARPQAARYRAGAAGEDAGHGLRSKANGHGPRGPEPLHAGHPAGRRLPAVDDINAQQTLDVAAGRASSGLIDKTHFSMAQQDVRYYLNGMLLETDGKIAANGRDRRPSPRAVRSRRSTANQPRPSRSSCRARACWSCSACSATKATSSWRSAAITFAPRSATFASLRS